MNRLTTNECAKWLTKRGGRVAPDGKPALDELGSLGIRFDIPSEGRSQVVLADSLGRGVAASGALLWVTDWQIYTTQEMDIFGRVHSPSGQPRPLIEAPGLLFDDSSDRAGVELSVSAFLMMAFNWEGVLFSQNLGCQIWFADEIAEAWTSRPEDNEHIQRSLHSCGLQIEDISRSR